MKKSFVALLAAMFLSMALMAQEKKPIPQKEKTQQPMHMEKHMQMMSECCIMEGGKMMHYKDGKQTPITREMNMGGMMVSPDGTCKMKNGKMMKLSEGECCDTTGMMHKNCAALLKKS